MTFLFRVTATALLVCSSAVFAQTTPGALHQKGRAAMEAGSHAEAEILFRRAIALEPSVVQHRISLAEALIAQQRLREAEAILAAIPPASRTRQGDLLLAQVRLWLGRLAEAAEGFRALTSADPGNVEAREGLARALYWAGDWPAAAAEYRSVLAIQPENEAARQALAEISIVSAAHAEAGVSIARDDQPYRRARSFVSFSPATESLTRWRVEAGSWFLDAEAHDVSATAPYVGFHMSKVMPRLKLSTEAWVRAQRFADDETKILGGGAIRRSLASNSRLSLAVEQRELLYTTSSLLSHPHVTAATLRWDLEQPSGWYAAAFAEGLRYFDGNSGIGLGGYAAAPVVQGRAITVWLGAGASYRDTEESRFRLDSVASRPVAGGFAYEYRGIYDPYWTPVETMEARAVTALQWRAGGGSTLKVYADGGVATETVLGFGPEMGTTPVPPPGAGPFERQIYPWRAGFELVHPLGQAGALVVGYEHFVTAFYVSDEASVRFSRRF